MKKIAAWLEPEKNYLWAVLGLGFLLRLALVVKTGSGGLSPDATDWMATAWSVASGEGFGGSWRPPGFVFFLAGVFSVFGKSVLAAKLANVLVGTATLFLVYRIAELLFERRTARVALLLTSFYPYLLAYTADVLSETLLTFMLAAGVLAVVRTAQRPSWKSAAVCGLLIGCAGLTKSVVLPFFLLACAWLWWRTGRFAIALTAGLFTLLAITPWTLRNYFHYDKSYVMPVNTPWYSLYGSTCDEALEDASKGEITKGPGVPQVDQFLPPDWEYVGSLPLPERDKYCKEKALGWIEANPDKYRRLLGLRLLHFWRLYPVIAYGWQKAAAMATSGLYIPLALAGFFLARRNFGNTSLLLALFASYTAVHLPFAVTLRYRVPIDPYIIIMAAYAAVALYGRFRSGPRGDAAA